MIALLSTQGHSPPIGRRSVIASLRVFSLEYSEGSARVDSGDKAVIGRPNQVLNFPRDRGGNRGGKMAATHINVPPASTGATGPDENPTGIVHTKQHNVSGSPHSPVNTMIEMVDASTFQEQMVQSVLRSVSSMRSTAAFSGVPARTLRFPTTQAEAPPSDVPPTEAVLDEWGDPLGAREEAIAYLTTVPDVPQQGDIERPDPAVDDEDSIATGEDAAPKC